MRIASRGAFCAVVTAFFGWSALVACSDARGPTPAEVASRPSLPKAARVPPSNAATLAPAPIASPGRVDGLALDLSRSEMVAAIRGRGLARETVKSFADGGEEARFHMADGALIRLQFPDSRAESRPRAIIVSTADAASSTNVLSSLVTALGPPTWTSSERDALMWHARVTLEDVVVPDARAPFVAQFHASNGQPPTYTIARTDWYLPKGR